MTHEGLCMLFETILALIETGNSDKAAEIVKNGIKRIDKNYENTDNNDK